MSDYLCAAVVAQLLVAAAALGWYFLLDNIFVVADVGVVLDLPADVVAAGSFSCSQVEVSTVVTLQQPKDDLCGSLPKMLPRVQDAPSLAAASPPGLEQDPQQLSWEVGQRGELSSLRLQLREMSVIYLEESDEQIHE